MRQRVSLRTIARLAASLSVLAALSCVDRLPDQDLRILSAVPIDRVSASVLWDDFQKDAEAAGRRYRGQPLVVTGPSPTLIDEGPGRRFLRYVLTGGRDGAIQASLLDEQAEAILAAATSGQRVDVKCFCEGLSRETKEIVLKSCVAP
jgi:hypothetical protein